jgi:hypothetical protein
VSDNQNIVLFGDAPFSVSEVTAFVLGGRPGAFFFLLVIATGLLLFSTSKKQPPPNEKEICRPVCTCTKNGGKNTPVSMPHTPVNDEKSKQKCTANSKRKSLMRLTSYRVQGLFPPSLPPLLILEENPFQHAATNTFYVSRPKKQKNGLYSKLITHEKLR